jgi:hypothetical protein
MIGTAGGAALCGKTSYCSDGTGSKTWHAGKGNQQARTGLEVGLHKKRERERRRRRRTSPRTASVVSSWPRVRVRQVSVSRSCAAVALNMPSSASYCACFSSSSDCRQPRHRHQRHQHPHHQHRRRKQGNQRPPISHHRGIRAAPPKGSAHAAPLPIQSCSKFFYAGSVASAHTLLCLPRLLGQATPAWGTR